MDDDETYRCPICGETAYIDVDAKVQIRITRDGSDADESFDGSHEYDGDSPAYCRSCNYDGLLRDFDPDPDANADEARRYLELL